MLTPTTARPSLLGRLTGGVACAISLGLLLVLVTVRRYEFDATQLAILYLAIALSVLWTAYLLLALWKRRAIRRSTRAPRDTM